MLSWSFLEGCSQAHVSGAFIPNFTAIPLEQFKFKVRIPHTMGVCINQSLSGVYLDLMVLESGSEPRPH